MSFIESVRDRGFFTGGHDTGDIKQTCINFDDSNFIVIDTPNPLENVYLLSVSYAVTAPHVLTLKSGVDVIGRFAFDRATSLISGYVNTGLYFTGAGEALSMNLSIPGTVTVATTNSHEIASTFLRRYK